MLMRIFVAIVIIVAILAGLANHMSLNFMNMPVLHGFFDTAIPILGFGALIKYLCCCGDHHK